MVRMRNRERSADRLSYEALKDVAPDPASVLQSQEAGRPGQEPRRVHSVGSLL